MLETKQLHCKKDKPRCFTTQGMVEYFLHENALYNSRDLFYDKTLMVEFTLSFCPFYSNYRIVYQNRLQ